MIELIRTWLTGIACAAMVAALADAIMPEGAVKRVGMLAGGLVMMVAIVRPIIQADLSHLSAEIIFPPAESVDYERTLEEENALLMKDIISQQTGAYIQDKAYDLGVRVLVEVKCGETEDGVPYPDSVTVFGQLGQEEMVRLSRMIEENLAIPIQKQNFERTGQS